MKPGDLIMVWGGTQPRATLYEDSFLYHEVAVTRGTLGFVINGPFVTRDRLDGYVKVMLTGNLVGHIYKDAIRIVE